MSPYDFIFGLKLQMSYTSNKKFPQQCHLIIKKPGQFARAFFMSFI